MTPDEHTRKLEELDRLLNDPEVPMDPSRVWALLADLAGRHAGPAGPHGDRDGVMMRAGAVGEAVE